MERMHSTIDRAANMQPKQFLQINRKRPIDNKYL